MKLHIQVTTDDNNITIKRWSIPFMDGRLDELVMAIAKLTNHFIKTW